MNPAPKPELPPTHPSQQHGVVLAVLGRLLQPIVRLLLAHGVGYPALLEVLKRTYVSVAQNHFIGDPKAQTDSRISLLTGVHRKDIKRIREQPTPSSDPHKEPLAAQVLSRWLGHPDFLNPDHSPRALPKRAQGKQLGFEELVSHFSKDIRPRVLLDEWLQSGLVSEEAGLYQLHPERLFAQPAWQEQLSHLCTNVHDHCAAAVHNVLQPASAAPTSAATAARFFERNVFEDNLSQAQTQAIQALVAEEGMAFLQTINAKHHALAGCDKAQDTGAHGSTPRYRINTGVYVYVEALPTPLTENPHD